VSTLLEPGDTIRSGHPPMVSRYRLGMRLNHWITAITMVLLVLSGLAMFHPSLFFLTAIFGGGQNTRAIHPWFGVVLVASFLVLFLQVWRANLWTRSDWSWTAHLGDFVAGHEEKVPEAGKYNAGQKFVFWVMALLILALFASGIISWDRYFFDLTSVETKRIAILAHAIVAVLVILTLILHVYAGIWVRGSFDAMIRGWVSAGWAWRHHRQWFRALTGRIEPAE
jgi:formate dehydrogenase subunit gamma